MVIIYIFKKIKKFCLIVIYLDTPEEDHKVESASKKVFVEGHLLVILLIFK
jgi:hypothetical protein